jgi:V-type H+-transporting ATPase proteolipid subunit
MANPTLLTGLGAALSIFLCSVGSIVASAPSGLFALQTVGVFSMTPIIISGVLAIYGIIISVLLSKKMESDISESEGYKYLSAGLAVGTACLMSGVGMAKFLDLYSKSPVSLTSTDRAEQEEPLISPTRRFLRNPTAKFMMVFVFLEAIGLYGLIVSLFLIAK